MPKRQQLSVNRRNLIWFAVVAVAAVIGALVGGWKVALVAGAVALAVSEVVERSARRRRRNGNE